MGSDAELLALFDSLREPVIRAAIRTLCLPPGSCGLDAGCGIGSHTPLLAEAVAPHGHITGLDHARTMLARAGERAARSGLTSSVSFQEGDIRKLPFDDARFDWAWSVDCAGYAPGDPVAVLKEIARVVKPGGTVAILAWSSQQLLPGHPELEARLNATRQGIAPYARGMPPERHFLRAPGWFRVARIHEPRARTFIGEVHAPLSEELRACMIALFEMRWGDPGSELSADDLSEFRRLCSPASPDFLPDLADYYAFFTYSMFWGRVTR